MMDSGGTNFMFITCLWILFILSTLSLIWGIKTINHWYILPWIIVVGNFMLMTFSFVISILGQSFETANIVQIISFIIFTLIVFSLTGYCWLCVCCYYLEMLKQQNIIKSDSENISETNSKEFKILFA